MEKSGTKISALDLSSYTMKVFSKTRKFLLEISVEKGTENRR